VSAAELPLPPYTYVPNVVPHPISDADGHMFGVADVYKQWSNERVFDWGIRLFDAGYYWESHEAWEHLWLKLGRTTRDAMILKGLIKLAACGVKCLECNTNGAMRHASRATELLGNESESKLLGAELTTNAREIADIASHNPPLPEHVSDGRPQVLDGFGPLKYDPNLH
jgi:hypothetical protein